MAGALRRIGRGQQVRRCQAQGGQRVLRHDERAVRVVGRRRRHRGRPVRAAQSDTRHHEDHAHHERHRSEHRPRDGREPPDRASAATVATPPDRPAPWVIRAALVIRAMLDEPIRHSGGIAAAVVAAVAAAVAVFRVRRRCRRVAAVAGAAGAAGAGAADEARPRGILRAVAALVVGVRAAIRSVLRLVAATNQTGPTPSISAMRRIGVVLSATPTASATSPRGQSH